jgi:hypothetical protein
MKSGRKKKSVNRTNSPKNGSSRDLPSINPRKLWVFRLFLAIGVPIVFLATTELILRVIGFGYPTGFLLSSERDGHPVFVQNNRFGWRFFGPAMARIPEPICIPRLKDPDTIRIIVFGESAAQGDPQPDFGLSQRYSSNRP